MGRGVNPYIFKPFKEQPLRLRFYYAFGVNTLWVWISATQRRDATFIKSNKFGFRNKQVKAREHF